MRTPAGRYVSPNLHTWVGRAPGPCCPRGAEAFELHLCRDLCMIPRSCSCLPTRRHHRAQTTGSSMSPPCQILRTQGPREPEAWTRASRALPGSAQHHFAMSGDTGPLWSSLRTSQRIRLGDPQGLAPHAHISVTLRDPKTPCTHHVLCLPRDGLVMTSFAGMALEFIQGFSLLSFRSNSKRIFQSLHACNGQATEKQQVMGINSSDTMLAATVTAGSQIGGGGPGPCVSTATLCPATVGLGQETPHA